MSNSNGTLNIARLIEEAEAQLIGESPTGCAKCVNCKNKNAGQNTTCADRTNANHGIGQLLESAPR